MSYGVDEILRRQEAMRNKPGWSDLPPGAKEEVEAVFREVLEVKVGEIEEAMKFAIDNVVDHYFEKEVRHFLFDVDKDTTKEIFVNRLESSILRSLMVLRYGDQAKEMMEKLWYDQVEQYEAERVKEEKVSKRRAQVVKQLDEYYAKKAIVIQRAWRKYREENPWVLLPEEEAEKILFQQAQSFVNSLRASLGR